MTTTGPNNTTVRPVLSTDSALLAEPVHEETTRHIAFRYTLAAIGHRRRSRTGRRRRGAVTGIARRPARRPSRAVARPRL